MYEDEWVFIIQKDLDEIQHGDRLSGLLFIKEICQTKLRSMWAKFGEITNIKCVNLILSFYYLTIANSIITS